MNLSLSVPPSLALSHTQGRAQEGFSGWRWLTIFLCQSRPAAGVWSLPLGVYGAVVRIE